MMWQVLSVGQMGEGLQIGALIIGLAIAIIFHEVAHGVVALWLGDPTAKYAGRLSLNPVKHIDLWGTILVPLLLIVSTGGAFVFGWAKPVPVNYYNLRHGKYGPLLVALAGPATNLILLAFFGLLVRVAPGETALPALFLIIAMVNAGLMFFNLIPIPPLDGSKVLYVFLEHRTDVLRWLEQYGFVLLLALLVFGQGILTNFVFAPALYLVHFFSGVIPF